MRLAHEMHDGAPQLALVHGDRLLTVEELSGTNPSLAEVLADDRVAERLRGLDASRIADVRIATYGRPVEECVLGPAVTTPRQLLCIGRNYPDHNTEQGTEPPPAPLLFIKAIGSLNAPGADVRWDATATTQVDYEAELALVIGRRASNVSVDDALGHVFAWCCANDVSSRDLQFGDGQWARGKSLDGFCPLGPMLVTADEVADWAALSIECRVNGEVRQHDRTGAMFFSPAEIISHLSRTMVLEPGDVILTGTPGGVGIFSDPVFVLSDGDVMEVEIEGLGVLRNRCVVA